MGGRGTFAAGRNVDFVYNTTGFYNGVKILGGSGNRHGLPEEAHSSEAYLKLHPDGKMNMLRIYNKSHRLIYEFAYHPEPKLTGNQNPVLHVHYYDKYFNRSKAEYVPWELFKQYGNWMKGMKWYDK